METHSWYQVSFLDCAPLDLLRHGLLLNLELGSLPRNLSLSFSSLTSAVLVLFAYFAFTWIWGIYSPVLMLV